MNSMIRELCALSIFCGAALSIMPEGNVKRVAGILCSSVLIIAVITPIKAFDIESYADILNTYREKESRLAASSEEISERLRRAVIEEEYGAYIMDKAEKLGIEVKEARVEVQWSADGAWLPYSASIHANVSKADKCALEDKLEAELGLPPSKVKWADDG